MSRKGFTITTAELRASKTRPLSGNEKSEIERAHLRLDYLTDAIEELFARSEDHRTAISAHTTHLDVISDHVLALVAKVFPNHRRFNAESNRILASRKAKKP